MYVPERATGAGPSIERNRNDHHRVPINITCPDWCTVSAAEHAGELWNNGGDCFHHMEVREVTDPAGREALSEPKFCDPIELFVVEQYRAAAGDQP